MATDANMALQAGVTKTASFNGAGLTIGSTPRRGLKARFLYSAATNASGSNSATFGVDASFDGGATWFQVGNGAKDVVNLSTTAQAGEIAIPFEVSQTSTANPVQIRATVAIAGAGSTPTITYQADLMLGRP